MTKLEVTAPFRTFILKVANRCNIDCDYCFVFNSKDQAAHHLPARMSLDVAGAAARRIGEHATEHGLSAVHVVLHGGEPMLAGIRHMADLLGAVRDGIPAGTDVRFELQTNGSTAHPSTTQHLPSERGTWQTWPTEAAWDVDIPAWATRTTVTVTLAGLRIEGGSIWAELRTQLAGTAGKATVIEDNQSAIHRVLTTLAHAYPLTSALRGTVQRLTVQTNQSTKSGNGDLYVAEGTAIVATVDFAENPE
ncbi:hypothetical protein ACWDGI_25390 [Streptomyces sp. NPDC001220]